ncbi:peroxisome proliferator-activated receptor gamma coactivator-related protein 1 isoform X1 [Pygocentrus nattereri]|nr:peroxisome proliferator-activated receptor gamma coactivator-related protein 1 isoform X1 [Pygocentrus nattereri]
MAAPRGDLQKNLNAGFTEFTSSDATQDTQGEFERSHTPGFGHDVDSTSSNLHGILEPSILSIFEDTSASGEVKNLIDGESEATLLSALSEMLDSVIEDTLSPFDTLPDTDLFVGQRSHDSKFRRSSDKDAAPRITRSSRSSVSNTKAEVLLSDRQLRPRLNQRIQTTTVQRSDGEEEDPAESRRRPIRSFRIESDPELYQDEQQDGYVFVSLVDLVRHMHPYSLRVGLVKEEGVRDVGELQEEDVFVDVVGDDELQGTHDANVSGFSPEKKFPHPQTPAAVSKSKKGLNKEISVARSKEMCSSSCGGQNNNDVSNEKPHKSVLATSSGAGRVKKKVSFAPDLASVHEYQVEDDASECHWSDTPTTEELKTSTSEPFQHNSAKPKSISLQEYRLLRGKTLPKEERKVDYRTKWPSIPEPPCELPPIPCIPGYSSTQVNSKTSFTNAGVCASGSPTKPRRDLHMPVKSPPKQKAVQAVDPPNPVIVPLPTLVPIPAKTSWSSEEQSVAQQKTAANSQPAHLNPQLRSAASQTSKNLNQPGSHNQETLSCGSCPLAEVPQAECSSTIISTTKTNASPQSLPTMGRLSQTSLRRRPLVQIPTNVRDHCAEEQRQESKGEIGIQATDVTSLLEQFETQGLTPPATPPHQIWKPQAPSHRAKQHEAIKPSPSKAIQIIEPRPLPPSRVHSKPQQSTSVPAPSLFLAFRDHDYCGTQEIKDCNVRSFSALDAHKKSLKEQRSHTSHTSLDHRTFCEEELIPGSVLLSPESSPCRLEEGNPSAVEEGEADSRQSFHHSLRSARLPARGRTRRRHYYGSYHSDSSSVSSSRSSSCSSSASSSLSPSPPRKRRRSRHSKSSTSSSSRSSSSSLSPSPIRKRQRRYTRSSRSYSRSRSRSRSCSRSYSRSRSRSLSPQRDWRNKWSRWKRQREQCQGRWEEAHRIRKQKAIEERRVVYVGRIRGTMTEDELRDRFALFGKIEDCTVHFRSHGDNYGFVTYYNTDDAFAAIESGTKLRQPDELPFDICFGGRRQFCQSNYADLDANRDIDSSSVKKTYDSLDFDTLLKQAQRGVKR